MVPSLLNGLGEPYKAKLTSVIGKPLTGSLGQRAALWECIDVVRCRYKDRMDNESEGSKADSEKWTAKWTIHTTVGGESIAVHVLQKG